MNDPKELAAQFVESFNERDGERLKSLFTEDVEWLVPGATLRGIDEIAAMERSFWRAFPDCVRTIKALVAEGPLLVEEGILTGTHLGPFSTPGGDIPASQNQVSVDYVMVMGLKEGLFCSKHLYFDTLDLLGQIGAVPIPAEAQV